MATRRRFVAALTSFAGLGFAPQAPPAGGWDLSWLDRFKGKHKQVFDLGSFNLSIDTPLRVPMNYLDTFRDVYRLEPPAINVAIGNRPCPGARLHVRERLTLSRCIRIHGLPQRHRDTEKTERYSGSRARDIDSAGGLRSRPTGRPAWTDA